MVSGPIVEKKLRITFCTWFKNSLYMPRKIIFLGTQNESMSLYMVQLKNEKEIINHLK
jgi:hypothetical protein